MTRAGGRTHDATTVSSPKLDRVLVGVDFGESSRAAAEYVARAFAPGAELVLAHAIHVPAPPGFLSGIYPPADRVVAAARAGAEQKLRELGGAIATGLVWPEVRVGSPEEALAGVARDYRVDLVAVGPRTERPGIRDRLGGTPERVLRHTRLPLLLAVPAGGEPPRRILAAVDGSAATRRVLAWMELLMSRHGAAATLVHAVSPLPPLAEDASLTNPLAANGTTAGTRARSLEAGRWLEEQRSALAHRDRIDTTVLVGRPATTIAAAASRGAYDLVVLGTHGRGALGRLAFGSVAEELLRAAPGPVLVVPQRPESPASGP